ncbi:type I-MYXAN CRISPR-associated Cas8a1/Cmx1 [Fimbriiglobus ruber]|uniref:CRISPR-associated protein n=1 Tax=Fimbriiglobus ruber TaxID=1908690 RepID=A0A225D6Q4_9BACT|nr:type I-MYXAN CRISPR-associated Cas8a1/Cmx1 [Fimbriiglobus ruber]OWK34208.1 CRISPR-associated protein [Fimbriiglobus ruber]
MAKVTKAPAPDHLTMGLFGPGMSLLHRAGLGGLACTLRAMEREQGDRVPTVSGGDALAWDVTEQTVSLRFGRPENAAELLKRLFAFAFTVRKDGLISLPGQYDIEPPAAILADLQSGLTLTFLQHGKVRQLAKESTTVIYDPEGEGVPGVVVEYRKCSGFKHQDGWELFVDKKGCLVRDVMKVDGPISPGTVVRHVAFTADTAVEDVPERMLPLYFALVGCLSLPVNRGVAALLVPDVQNLLDFVFDRPAMTPSTAAQCQIANAADAGLQAQWRLRRNPVRAARMQSRGRQLVRGTAIPSCHVMTFTPTPWASQQKSRVATITVPEGDDKLLDRFDRALTHLPTRIVTRTISESTGRGKQKVTTERRESFRSDSVVRPLIAENLALGRPWYAGFRDLMTKINPATGNPFRDRLPFERGGLHAMIADDTMWDTAGERIVVQAVHEALRGRYAQIADENKKNPVAMRNRFGGEYDRWRLAFAGSKTADQFRRALCDLFSRAGRNQVLQKQWADVLPMLRQNNWQHARDLALLALCSYQGNRTETTEPTPDQE